MQPRRRRLHVRPCLSRQPRRIEPLDHLRHLLHCLPARLLQHLARQPRRQRIHRLQVRQIATLLRGHDIIRMRHLHLIVVALDTARHEPHLAFRQLPRDECRLRMKEDQIDPPRLVLARHPKRRLRVPPTRFVFEHPHFKRRDRPRDRRRDRRRRPPVDHPRRRMPHQIDHPGIIDPRRQPQRLLQQHIHARPHPRDRLGGREQRIERSGTHGRGYGAPRAGRGVAQGGGASQTATGRHAPANLPTRADMRVKSAVGHGGALHGYRPELLKHELEQNDSHPGTSAAGRAPGHLPATPSRTPRHKGRAIVSAGTRVGVRSR